MQRARIEGGGWAQREARSGKLPSRYRKTTLESFLEQCEAALQPDVRILDIGAGRLPTIAPDIRPPRCTYVGMDLSLSELEAASDDAYTDLVQADACTFIPELSQSFDLILTYQTLEHVSSIRDAFDNARRYLREGGLLVAYFSGRYACFAIANRALPEWISRKVAAGLRLASEDEVFPAVYDDCHPARVRQHLNGWSFVRVIPLYHGAGYFSRLPALRRLYVAYESWAVRYERLATHVLVSARR